MSTRSTGSEQLATFTVDGDLFGIEVMKVQEVTGSPRIFGIPLAPPFVRGIVNLRGQIATALGLRELFGKSSAPQEGQMSVVCKIDGNLVSLVVDLIGDVVEVEKSSFEKSPETLSSAVKGLIEGVYKLNGRLLSVLDLEGISKKLSPAAENMSGVHQKGSQL